MSGTAVAAALALLLAVQKDPAPKEDRWSGLRDPELTRFLTMALVEGLFEDQADPAIVRAVAADRFELFIAKCPICVPVQHGFQIVAAAPAPPMYDVPGPGLPTEIEAQLRAKDLPTRKKGLEALVKRYVDRRFARLALSDAEKARLREQLDLARKKGMSYAGFKNAGDSCPACDGAAKPRK